MKARPSLRPRVTSALLLCALALITPIGRAAVTGKLPDPSSKAGVRYESDIKPIFERSCTKCHGEDKKKGKLRLDSRDAVLAGAEDGKVILPGKSDKSKLVLRVAKATDDEREWMPPPNKAQALSADEISLIRAWIDQGAQ